jgi:hypothetical protein
LILSHMRTTPCFFVRPARRLLATMPAISGMRISGFREFRFSTCDGPMQDVRTPPEMVGVGKPCNICGGAPQGSSRIGRRPQISVRSSRTCLGARRAEVNPAPLRLCSAGFGLLVFALPAFVAPGDPPPDAGRASAC